MNILKYLDIRSLVRQFKSEGLSMRRRFVVYVFSVIVLFLTVIIILLNLFGVLDPTDRRIMNDLSAHLSSCSEHIEHDCDELAACAISFSGQLEASVQNYLTENDISFDELKNDSESLDALQNRLYDSVYLNMQVAPASGAFYILDTTANSNSETDQTLKLKVRDRLLCEDVGKINGDLSKIKEVCENEIAENGFEYSVSADYGTYYFPSRTYENITLPAGDYRAIKVIIGEGKGENWWCVMYPPLCYSGATDGKLSEEKMNLLKNCMDKESFELIENSGIKIKPSLKIVELWQKIRHKFLA